MGQGMDVRFEMKIHDWFQSGSIRGTFLVTCETRRDMASYHIWNAFERNWSWTRARFVTFEHWSENSYISCKSIKTQNYIPSGIIISTRLIQKSHLIESLLLEINLPSNVSIQAETQLLLLHTRDVRPSSNAGENYSSDCCFLRLLGQYIETYRKRDLGLRANVQTLHRLKPQRRWTYFPSKQRSRPHRLQQLRYGSFAARNWKENEAG